MFTYSMAVLRTCTPRLAIVTGVIDLVIHSTMTEIKSRPRKFSNHVECRWGVRLPSRILTAAAIASHLHLVFQRGQHVAGKMTNIRPLLAVAYSCLFRWHTHMHNLLFPSYIPRTKTSLHHRWEIPYSTSDMTYGILLVLAHNKNSKIMSPLRIVWYLEIGLLAAFVSFPRITKE